jgi:hypothetical protein
MMHYLPIRNRITKDQIRCHKHKSYIFIYKAKYKIQVSFNINTKEHPQNKKTKSKIINKQETPIKN